MKRRWLRVDACALVPLFIFALTTALPAAGAQGEELSNAMGDPEIAPAAPPSVLEDSFRYHRLGELPERAWHPPAAPPGAPYRYGFPVRTHRWGWFGAEHYYPRVLWHRGYYGDHCRWCYRRGY